MGAEQPPASDKFAGAPADAAQRLQILATEHWSLLATRSLSYTESFSRVGMFFSVLSGAVIALALIAQAGRFGLVFLIAAILMLLIVIFVGVATIARLMTINRDDFRWVIAMNRIRHAYLEMHPELESYFTTGSTDDMRGVAMTLGLEGVTVRGIGTIGWVLQTLPGMLSLIVAVVAGALGALVAVALGASQAGAVATGVVAFLVVIAVLVGYGWRSVSGFGRGTLSEGLSPRFPSPRRPEP